MKKGIYSVKLKIIAIVAFIVVVLVGLMLSTLIETNRNYKELTLEAYRASVEKKCNDINRKIAELEIVVYNLASKGRILYETGAIETLGKETVMDNFKNQNIADGSSLSFEPSVLGKRFFCYTYRNSTGRIIFNSPDSDFDYTEREWYQKAKALSKSSKNFAWTKPYYDKGGPKSLMVSVSRPIYNNDGEFIGAAESDWEIATISDSVKSLGSTKNSFSIFADPVSDKILANTMSENRKQKLGINDSLSSLPWFDSAVQDGKVKLGSTEYFVAPGKLKNGMVVAIFAPENELYAEANGRVYMMLLVLAIAIIVIVYGSYMMLSRFVSKPISEISKKVEVIGGGDLDAKIEIKSRDEFGALAEAFNNMTDDLKEYIRNLTSVTSEKERIGAELNVANEIQESLLPTTFPAYPDRSEFDIYAMMRPAKEVGGDFYDFYYTGGNRLALIVADVSGKGVPAALFMVIAKTLLKNHLQMGESQSEALKNVNNQLFENNDVGMFVTAFIAILDIATGEVEYANAGHNPPLIMRAGERFEMLEVKPGFVLGGISDIKYASGKTKLNAGDVLYLYTDGVTEAENEKEELFGEKRMLAAADSARGGSMQNLVEKIRGAIDKFAGDAPQFDDITMLALRYEGAAKKKNGESKESKGGKTNKEDEANKGGESTVAEAAKLEIPAEVSKLDEALDFVETAADAAGASMKTLMQIRLAAEEIFVNIAKYAYAESDEKPLVWLAVETSGGKIAITFKDRGVAYNPLENEAPDITLSAEEREIGGLGIFMTKESMDELQYVFEDGFNKLTLLKRIS
jgi:sigma-B regulation protein RsbU (phosphoserine phosphatase)